MFGLILLKHKIEVIDILKFHLSHLFSQTLKGQAGVYVVISEQNSIIHFVIKQSHTNPQNVLRKHRFVESSHHCGIRK